MKDYEQITKFLDDVVNNSHLKKTFTDLERILDLDKHYAISLAAQPKESSANDQLWPHLEQYHMDVVKSAREVILWKSKKANAILRLLLEPVANKPVKEALPIIRAKCREYGPFDGIYPALRFVYLGFEHHIKASIKINSHYDGLAHMIPYDFIPFVLPEIMTNLDGMTLSAAEEFLQPVPANIITDLMKQYNHIVEGYGNILKEISRVQKRSYQFTKLFRINFTKNSKVSHPIATVINYSNHDPPNIQRASHTSKATNNKIPVIKNTITSKATKKDKHLIEINENLKFKQIETKIMSEFEKMLNDLEHSESELTVDERWNIQVKLDGFTDEVNYICMQWMKKLYDYVVKEIESRKG